MTSPDPQLDVSSAGVERSTDPPSEHALNASRTHNIHPIETVTDLPLTQSVNGVSRRPPDSGRASVTVEELLAALDQALLVPVAPPLHETDRRVVKAWVEEAARGLLYRRDRTRLVRDVLRILDDEWRSTRTVANVREQVIRKAELRQAREDGTYWTRRDSGRRANQPTHVDVDPDAWRRAKALAARQGVGIGEYVGGLIAAEVRAPSRRLPPPAAPTVRLFARVAIEHGEWRAFVADTHGAGLTVQRRIGLIVERL